MWAQSDLWSDPNPRPSMWMTILGVVVLALAVHGLANLVRRARGGLKRLHLANVARLEAKQRASADASSGADSRAAAAVDLGGIHLHSGRGRDDDDGGDYYDGGRVLDYDRSRDNDYDRTVLINDDDQRVAFERWLALTDGSGGSGSDDGPGVRGRVLGARRRGGPDDVEGVTDVG